MHSDEYEISLLKEVAVCSFYIAARQKTLQQLEQKYKLAPGAPADPSALFESTDRAAWLDARTSLASWEDRKREYEALHRLMMK